MQQSAAISDDSRPLASDEPHRLLPGALPLPFRDAGFRTGRGESDQGRTVGEGGGGYGCV